ncbi:hypothetical protein A1O1_03450 [Capronia coronata CBS 617.96]|uniref:N-acetyltransferase domain-containing protein n=1 Tax=Capronia coronata CBS 617.96 TaxID=1182541 RepID=W9YMB9_9EURO|nr:uncharacterized protein A1O1_03450 [Capronia coronata CBS 617.96]EXJ90351.1 hypothetical protein A1O1_03450 [Capronia coronata CBS 617.96]
MSPHSSLSNTTTNSTPCSPPSLPYTRISADSSSDLDHFISIITDAFSVTPLTTAFIIDNDGTAPLPRRIPRPRRERHFAQGILDSAKSNAELVHAGDWSAVALWEPPNFQGKAFINSRTRPGPLLGEWRSRVKAAKARHLAEASSSTASTPSTASETNSASDLETETLPSSTKELPLRPFYHLSFLARNPSVPRVQGSLNAVISPYLERARAEHVPAWLEATSRQASKLYEHYGFRVVEEIVVGKGKVDSEGWPTPDDQGEGVTAWAMIYDSHLRE